MESRQVVLTLGEGADAETFLTTVEEFLEANYFQGEELEAIQNLEPGRVLRGGGGGGAGVPWSLERLETTSEREEDAELAKSTSP
jgi:hypothetical protein